jgi:hypothetical protein
MDTRSLAPKTVSVGGAPSWYDAPRRDPTQMFRDRLLLGARPRFTTRSVVPLLVLDAER